MSLAESFRELVRACFSGIWIETLEASEAVQEIAAVCRDEEWSFATWDLEAGFRGSSAVEPVADPIGQVVAGWDKTLVGATVGSRMIVAIPPGDGYGEQGNPQAGIKGTATLYFVVDILAAS